MPETASERIAAAIAPYAALMASFARGEVDADEFQTRYFAGYLDDAREVAMDDATFDVVDGFFALVDSYVDDEQLRSPGEPTADDLRAGARDLLSRAGLAVSSAGPYPEGGERPRA